MHNVGCAVAAKRARYRPDSAPSELCSASCGTLWRRFDKIGRRRRGRRRTRRRGRCRRLGSRRPPTVAPAPEVRTTPPVRRRPPPIRGVERPLWVRRRRPCGAPSLRPLRRPGARRVIHPAPGPTTCRTHLPKASMSRCLRERPRRLDARRLFPSESLGGRSAGRATRAPDGAHFVVRHCREGRPPKGTAHVRALAPIPSTQNAVVVCTGPLSS